MSPRVGLVQVPGLEPLFGSGLDRVDAMEIEPETCWRGAPGDYAIEQLVADVERRTHGFEGLKLIHSVGFGLGGRAQPSLAHLRALRACVSAVDAPWISAHLAVTHADAGRERLHAGFMLPPLQSEEGVEIAAANIRAFAREMPVPVAVENGVNYMAVRRGELADGDFLAAVLEAADCGLVLDLHNLWTNEVNGRAAVSDVLAALPLDRVWEIHLGGGFEFEGYWLDAHSGEAPQPVMKLLAETVPRCPHLEAIVFEIFPSFVPSVGIARVRAHIAAARSVAADAPPRSSRPNAHIAVHRQRDDVGVRVRAWDEALVRLAIGRPALTGLERELEADPAIPMMRSMVWRFRASAIAAISPTLIRYWLMTGGPALVEAQLDHYFADHPPSGFASIDALRLLRWAGEFPIGSELEAVIAYDDARIRASLDGRSRTVRLGCDPRPVLEALSQNRRPVAGAPGHFELAVSPRAAEAHRS